MSGKRTPLAATTRMDRICMLPCIVLRNPNDAHSPIPIRLVPLAFAMCASDFHFAPLRYKLHYPVEIHKRSLPTCAAVVSWAQTYLKAFALFCSG
jgi:hypothetical protein